MLEPHEAYELYTRQQDEAYERLIKDKTHETCTHVPYNPDCCYNPPYVKCSKYDIWVPSHELVQGVCDCYTED